MIDEFYTWQFWAIVILLFGAIWIKIRDEKSRSYREGVIKGFLSGVGFTVQVIADKNLIENPKDNSIPMTQEELIRMLSPMLTKELLKMEKPKV